MKPRICLAMCAALVFGATMAVLAQDPASPRQSPSQGMSSAKAITVTGCVEKATPGPAGTTGATGAAPAASEPAFKLTNASAKASEPGGAAGTAGAAAAPASTASEYKLDASESKLSAHVGHKVEITGTVEAAKPTASASDAPNLKVDSVKMIAASCS